MSIFNFSGFETHQYCWLVTGMVFFCLSVGFHLKKKENWAISFLVIAGAAFFTFAALLDPYINLWDERVHAVVAQNTMNDFLKPLFYNHAVVPENNYLQWVSADVWLHKQPLFIWQIALSFKLFGVSEFTLRLPSVIMATISILIGYRIAALLINRKFAFYTALCITFSWFLMNLVSGQENVEHNDVCFFFYVSASVWAWMEYIHSNRKWQWAILAGFLCGCAILTKWLTGLVLYLIWGIYLLSEYKFQFKDWKLQHFFMALCVTIVIVLPWQIFIYTHYPDAAFHEYQHSSRHLFEELEGHGDPFYFYFKTLAYLFIGYSTGTPNEPINGIQILTYLILLTGWIFLIKSLKKKSHKITLITTFLFIYLFFSLAATKMPAYPFMISLIGFMGLGMFLYIVDNQIIKFISNQKIQIALRFVCILFFALYLGNFNRIRLNHTDECWWRKDMIANKETFEKMGETLPGNTLIFNVKGSGVYGMNMQFIEATFYSKRDCYALIPSKETIQNLKKMGFRIACFTQNPPPDYILNDAEIILIPDIILNDL